ncbi:hypothetical protein LX36DRAFT_236647 [Colletotrichum falcatum]|nr:hypothetical protein LX36DRAFT_236647 [Colletotrichum falcatum]
MSDLHAITQPEQSQRDSSAMASFVLTGHNHEQTQPPDCFPASRFSCQQLAVYGGYGYMGAMAGYPLCLSSRFSSLCLRLGTVAMPLLRPSSGSSAVAPVCMTIISLGTGRIKPGVGLAFCSQETGFHQSGSQNPLFSRGEWFRTTTRTSPCLFACTFSPIVFTFSFSSRWRDIYQVGPTAKVGTETSNPGIVIWDDPGMEGSDVLAQVGVLCKLEARSVGFLFVFLFRLGLVGVHVGCRAKG